MSALQNVYARGEGEAWREGEAKEGGREKGGGGRRRRVIYTF